MTINNKRRQFLQHSALGLASAAFPGLLLAKTGQLKSQATRGFNPDIEISMTARTSYVPIGISD